LFDASRSRPAPSAGERVAFIALGPAGIGTQDTVLSWDSAAQTARHLVRLPVRPEGVHFLGPTTSAMAMVQDLESFLVPLDGSRSPIEFQGIFLAGSFTLLDPGFLYNVTDLKFYRARPPLQRTTLPAKLADLPDGSNPIGDYHVIRVRGGNALSLLP
ncbi:MAG: hypothetical protein AABZ16_15750, partial [candidate division NC10 bacterium]